jgi:hypothetical protein
VLAEMRGSSGTPRIRARVQDDDSDTPVPQTGKIMRARIASQAPTSMKTGTTTESKVKSKPKTKPQRIAVDSSDGSDSDDLSRLKIANVGSSKRRPAPGSARKANLADFGMRDDESVSEEERRPRNGAQRDESMFESSGRTGDEDAVSHMVAPESAQVTPVGALSHMSNLGGASLGIRKPTIPSSSAARATKTPKRVVVADSDSDGGGFKGFGAKRRKRGTAS